MEQMGWLAWVIVGAASGWMANMMLHSRLGLLMDIIAGIAGAVVGGLLFSIIGAPGSIGFNIWGIFVAFIGAVILLGLLRLFAGERSTT